MKAAGAMARTKSGVGNKRRSIQGQRAIGTTESENSKNKARAAANGRIDDTSDIGPQDIDDLELQKSIQGSNKGPRKQADAQRNQGKFPERKLSAAKQSKSQV